MKPYYSDDLVTLYHGRCEDVLPTLNLSGSVHLLTDPPYFKVKDDDWDNQWSKSAEFLDWMGAWLDLAKPHLSPDSSVWVFASPGLTSAVESVVSSRFRVLNSVRWAKEGGDNLRRVSLPSMRSFVSIWEGIIFAEQMEDAYSAEEFSLHAEVFAPIGGYIRSERERAGKTKKQVAGWLNGYKNVSSATANIWNWELGKNLPSNEDYQSLRLALGLGYLTREHDEICFQWEKLRAEFELRRRRSMLRRPFTVGRRHLSEDIWHFPSVAGYPGKHPCEKPSGLLAHMIETTTRPGDTIMDCFAGSGAVLDVARQLGRKAIGIEMDKHWCGQIAKRLSQQSFDLGAIA
jgi:adenine-specific DNA-methyltransferase